MPQQNTPLEQMGQVAQQSSSSQQPSAAWQFIPIALQQATGGVEARCSETGAGSFWRAANPGNRSPRPTIEPKRIFANMELLSRKLSFGKSAITARECAQADCHVTQTADASC
jgi:hypothetical protein